MRGIFGMLIGLAFAAAATAQRGQQVRRIYFNLYTDSIKTQLNYYVNVEAEMSNERYLPMDTSMIEIVADRGRMSGNEWIPPQRIDFDRVRFTVRLKGDPSMRAETTVFLKRTIDPRDDPSYGDVEMPVVPKELQKRR